MGFSPTPEQEAALAAFRTGQDMVLEAGAGTGKTSTLKLFANTDETRRGTYVAYNKSIATSAGRDFPARVRCVTAHSLAYRAIARTWGDALRARLGGARVPARETARILGANHLALGDGLYLSNTKVARHAMETVTRFCYSGDSEPQKWHVPAMNGVVTTEQRALLVNAVLPLARKAWADLAQPAGHLRFTHDCQPPGTLVRRVVRGGGHLGAAHEDVPIEQLREGDMVVSFTMSSRLGYIRRAGRRVNAIGYRDYAGDLITVHTDRGRTSSYTDTHKCVVRLDGDLADGNHVVYLARRGDDYRVGRTTWRTKTQGNALGIRRRAESQKADAMWILSVHETDADAALAEALAGHQWRLPTWQFQSANETMPLSQFWAKVGNNRADAAACLAAHGRSIAHPFWERGAGWETTRRPVVMRALNLLSGMEVLEADEVMPNTRGALSAHDGSNGWAPARVTRSPYDGPVYNLDVDVDHTYVADGIATHNCYLKLWALTRPKLEGDYLLLDEAQDANPLVAQLVADQDHLQRIAVGDANQSIYGWRGATDFLSTMDRDHHLFLTQSFRFGPAVAEEANKWLTLLGSQLRLTGTPAITSVLAPLQRADAVLCRSNAGAVERLMKFNAQGVRACLVGGGNDVKRLAEAALELRETGQTWHPELCAFTSWGQVQDYVEEDASGGDLKVAVKLIDEYGAEVIIAALNRMAPERDAEVMLSTAHKAKGLEWDRVQIADDFKEPKGDSDEPVEIDRGEAMLAYVAVTRAQKVLDRSGLAWVDHYLPGGIKAPKLALAAHA